MSDPAVGLCSTTEGGPVMTPPVSATTAVIEVSGVHWASSKAVTEAVLGRRPGVMAVDANPVSQTATVTYDPARTTIAALAGWVRECGYHCAGQCVPDHVCDPMAEPALPAPARPAPALPIPALPTPAVPAPALPALAPIN